MHRAGLIALSSKSQPKDRGGAATYTHYNSTKEQACDGETRVQLDWILGTKDTYNTVQHCKVYKSSEMIRFNFRSKDHCMVRTKINLKIAKSAATDSGKRSWALLKDPHIAKEYAALLRVKFEHHDKTTLQDLYAAGKMSVTEMSRRQRPPRPAGLLALRASST